MDGEQGDRDGGRQTGTALPTRRRARHLVHELSAPAPRSGLEPRPDDELLRRVLDGLLPR